MQQVELTLADRLARLDQVLERGGGGLGLRALLFELLVQLDQLCLLAGQLIAGLVEHGATLVALRLLVRLLLLEVPRDRRVVRRYLEE